MVSIHVIFSVVLFKFVVLDVIFIVSWAVTIEYWTVLYQSGTNIGSLNTCSYFNAAKGIIFENVDDVIWLICKCETVHCPFTLG